MISSSSAGLGFFFFDGSTGRGTTGAMPSSLFSRMYSSISRQPV